MRVHTSLSALFTAALTVAATASAQPAGMSSKAPAPAFSDPGRVAKLATAFPEIDRLMRAFATRSNVPGIAYGIIIDGKLAHIGVSGLREVATNSPVDSVTVFRIASMTKSFTAVAILQLRDAGKLSLDAPAERYVPQLAKLRFFQPRAILAPISVRQSTCRHVARLQRGHGHSERQQHLRADVLRVWHSRHVGHHTPENRETEIGVLVPGAW